MTTFVVCTVLAIAACNQGGQSAASSESQAEAGEFDGYEIINVEGSPAERVVKRNADGTVVEEGMLYNGQKIGAWITYEPEGNFPAKLITYAGGQYNGTYLEFNQRGHITLRATYKNNQLHGPWAAYSFGRVEKKANYKNGELDGTYLEYNKKTGKIQKEANYKDGVQHGTYRFYDEEGNVMLEYEYRNGEKVEGTVQQPAAEE